MGEGEELLRVRDIAPLIIQRNISILYLVELLS